MKPSSSARLSALVKLAASPPRLRPPSGRPRAARYSALATSASASPFPSASQSTTRSSTPGLEKGDRKTSFARSSIPGLEKGDRKTSFARSSIPGLEKDDRKTSFARSFATSACSSTPSSTSRPKHITILGQTYETDDYFNVPQTIQARINPHPVLPYQPSHPLELLRTQIESHLSQCTPIKAPSAIVTTDFNFGSLGFPEDHPGRSPTDTYYINRGVCLRTHTSAHEVEVFAAGHEKWLLTADVFRRDEIDASHYPVFHQMEAASIWSLPEAGGEGDFAPGGVIEKECEAMEAKLADAQIVIEDDVSIEDAGGWQEAHLSSPETKAAAELALRHLKGTLNGLVFELFGARHAADVAAASAQSAGKGSEAHDPLRVRWISATFPFTSPSFEVEVWFRGKWLEILGTGIVKQKTLINAGVVPKPASEGDPAATPIGKLGWAFGLGLERIAMVLFSIPDIRLFWSKDPRFLSQFSTPLAATTTKGVSPSGGNTTTETTAKQPLMTFKPFSKYPPCIKDISFWLPSPKQPGANGIQSFHENDFMELLRDVVSLPTEGESASNPESDVSSDLIESVSLIDSFTHPKSARESRCYRIVFRSMERSLTDLEINALMDRVKERCADLGVELR